MRRTAFLAILALGLPALLFAQASADSGWVNNQEGCWCGYQTGLTRNYKVLGQYSTLADRQAGADTLTEWNRFATMFQVEVEVNADKFGAPGNGKNELNILIDSADTQSIYGFTMTESLYGRGVIEPSANFGNFNECKDFSSAGCAAFTQTDVVMNKGFSAGWTSDWYQDGGGQNPALIQTTAIHEVGHTLGLHHVFTLPAFGDSFSTMNYANDDSMKWITRMDAKTIRQQYNARVNSFTDIAIFPFTYGNAQYAETYASLSSTSVAAGGSVNLQNWLIQNVGTAAASNVVATFYLWPAGTRQYPQPTDTAVGTATFGTVAADSEADQASTPLTIPQAVPQGQYNFGAIVTVNGAEDAPFVAGKYPGNNRFILGHATRTVVTVSGAPTPLTSGVPVSGSVSLNAYNYYSIAVGPGATKLDVRTTGASADIDLYLKFNASPTTTANDCKSETESGNETITIPDTCAVTLSQGSWTIGVFGYAAGSYTLTATVTGGTTCSVACTATVPSTGTAASPVSFSSTATPTGCSGSPSFSWNFGDGQTSAQQNPSHTYSAAGTFSWSLTVTVAGQTCTKSGSITISGGGGGRKAGDCNADGTVSITELQQVVNNQLGISSTGCGDCDGNSSVSITELQKTVNCQLGMGNCDANCQH